MNEKEFNKEAKRVFFDFSEGDQKRGNSALSFDTILALAERIKLEESKAEK